MSTPSRSIGGEHLSPTFSVLGEVGLERTKQDQRWGEQNHPDGTGEVYAHLSVFYRSVCDRKTALREVSWKDIFLEEVYEAVSESDEDRLRHELIQVAAVAVEWVESIDRRKTREE